VLACAEVGKIVDALTRCWGKLRGAASKESSYHPLVCHQIDVGNVAGELWVSVLSPAKRGLLAAGMGLSEAAAERWLRFLAALHDLGKASPTFQLRSEAAHLTPSFSGWPAPLGPPHPLPHGHVTAVEAAEILRAEFSIEPQTAGRLAVVIGGHHGVFPTSADLATAEDFAGERGDGPWCRTRLELARELGQVCGVSGSPVPTRLSNPAAIVLAGLVSVADWIGSMEEFFPYAASGPDGVGCCVLEDYRSHSRERARQALRELGWTGRVGTSRAGGFRELFPFVEALRPVQQVAVDLAEALPPDQPGLAILEAPTGEGKTEAALYLADHWTTGSGAQGFYVALPSQATSNQMFGRVRDFLERRDPAHFLQLQLLHGHASLSAEFEVLRRRAGRVFDPTAVAVDERSGAIASDWFTHRKRGLLAPFGVGTIDQALMAVLQTRHVFVRLHGLAGKVLIIDEVHAYDTYMSALLDRLLEWLAALRSPVVLLSATLPRSRRVQLELAYARGLQVEPASPAPGPYPRCTWLTSSRCGTAHIEVSDTSARTLTLDWIDRDVLPGGDTSRLVVRLQDNLRDGGCAAIVCNTVGQAQSLYRELKPYFAGRTSEGVPSLDLLHARFPFGERQARERRTLARFGPNGDDPESRRPSRAVLVATQIIEQSLDLDFDLMVSDLAPIDLLLQRAGRLQRHRRQRPRPLRDPVLVVYRPLLSEARVPAFGAGTEAVYSRLVLLRTWLALAERARLRVPDDVEQLIEAVYGESPALPPSVSTELRSDLDAAWRSHQRDLDRQQQEAANRWMRRPSYDGPIWKLTEDPRDEDRPEFHPAHQALTRLALPSVQVVCLYGGPTGAFLSVDEQDPVDLTGRVDSDEAERLLMNSVSLTNPGVVHALLEASPLPGWRSSPLLRHCRPLYLDGRGYACIGNWTLHLDDEVGLEITRNTPARP
jgi:CRISPR-associated endonuclease/helicase Cas3